MKIHLLLIDPQNDFADPKGSLFVPGADKDMQRLAEMILRLKDKIDDIHVTLDSHRRVDISHPIWWKDASGHHPPPFSLLSAEQVTAGEWTTSLPSFLPRSLEYLESLQQAGRYPHTIWPEHCIIGDAGHNIAPVLAQAIHRWEDRFAQANYVTKGSNPWTEHFSAVQAEVPDPGDPTTHINSTLVQTLEEADLVVLAGEAATHCLLNTVADIADNFADRNCIQKLVWLSDATSPVPDPPGTTLFSDRLNQVFADLTAKGMQVSTTADFLR